MTPDALATLLSDPSRADVIPREDIPKLLGQLEELKAVLTMRMLEPPKSTEAPEGSSIERASEDRLLTAGEAAERLGVDRRWIYRRADSLPFTRRLGERTLRFSEWGLRKWLDTRE